MAILVTDGAGYIGSHTCVELMNAEIIIEIKYAATFRGLDEACAKAMEQIKTRRYDSVCAMKVGRIYWPKASLLTGSDALGGVRETVNIYDQKKGSDGV